MAQPPQTGHPFEGKHLPTAKIRWELDIVVRACNPSTQEVGTGESELQGHSQPHSSRVT